jgi:hypothetical protein
MRAVSYGTGFVENVAGLIASSFRGNLVSGEAAA